MTEREKAIRQLVAEKAVWANMTGDLEFLLSVIDAYRKASEEKIWCKHIKWYGRIWQFYRGGLYMCLAEDEWQCCPLCMTKRPEKTGMHSSSNV